MFVESMTNNLNQSSVYLYLISSLLFNLQVSKCTYQNTTSFTFFSLWEIHVKSPFHNIMKLRFERYFSHGRNISRNVASLNILVHNVIKKSYCMYTEQTSKNSSIITFGKLFKNDHHICLN